MEDDNRNSYAIIEFNSNDLDWFQGHDILNVK